MHCKTLAPMPTGLAMSALMMASAALAADAQAQATDSTAPDPKSAAKDVQRLGEVTVQGWAELQPSSPKLPKSLLDTPETITIIPAVVMQQQGASSLLQVMRNAPGISMLAGEGGTGGAPGDSFTIRGFNARKDIFVDGVRDFGSYSRDPFNLSQVEIVQGPSSFLGGRGSTGGAINLVTKQPLATTFYAGSISGGTDSYKRLTVDVNQSLDNVGDGSGIKGAAFRINAVGFDADQPGRDLVSNSRGGVDANMTFGLGTPGQVSFGYFYMKQDNQPDFGIPFVPIGNNAVPGVAGYGNKVAPVDYTNYYGLVERDHEDISTNIARMTITYDFQNGVVVRNHTQYGSTNRDSILSAPRFINTTTTAINHELQSLDERDTNITNQTDVTIKFATGSVKHIVTTGAEFAYETSLVKARGAYNPGTSPATSAPLAAAAFPTTDLFNPDPYQPYSYSVLYTGAYSDTTAHSAALYAFDNVDFNEQWSVMAGLRWDRFSAEAKNVSSLFTGNAVTNLSRVDNMVSWRASVFVQAGAQRQHLFRRRHVVQSVRRRIDAGQRRQLAQQFQPRAREEHFLRARHQMGVQPRPIVQRRTVPHRKDQCAHRRPLQPKRFHHAERQTARAGPRVVRHRKTDQRMERVGRLRLPERQDRLVRQPAGSGPAA